MFPIFVRKKLILSILQKQKEGNLTDFPSYAESEGFEPPVRRNAYTAFRVRLFRPLRQLSFYITAPTILFSVIAGAKVLLFFELRKLFCVFFLFRLRFWDYMPYLGHAVRVIVLVSGWSSAKQRQMILLSNAAVSPLRHIPYPDRLRYKVHWYRK